MEDLELGKQPSHNDLSWQNQSKKVVYPTTNYTVLRGDDIILCNSAITVTLPVASRGREIIVNQNFSGGSVTILPSSTDTLVGDTSVVTYVKGTSLHFKAVTGGYVII